MTGTQVTRRGSWTPASRRHPCRWIESAAMPRSCLRAMPDGVRLCVSLVEPADGRWRIDVLEARRPEDLDSRSRRATLTAATAGVESVKDPVIVRHSGGWLMYASFGSRDLRVAAGSDDGRHANDDPLLVSGNALRTSGDPLSTGQLLSCT